MAGAGLILRAALARLGAVGAAAANRLSARRAALLARPAELAAPIASRAVGGSARAGDLAAGRFAFAGVTAVEPPGTAPWSIAPPTPDFADALHGFAWTDDLAMAGDATSRRLLRAWVFDWVRRHGGGGGPGWQPGTTGRRLMRWTLHAPLILRGADPADAAAFLTALDAQARHLAGRWRRAPAGLARIEAVTGLLYAALGLSGWRDRLAPVVHGLGEAVAATIRPDGGIESRNPEALTEILTLLVWAARTLEDAGKLPDPRHLAGIQRAAPALRTLRHGDGTLARFHGGGAGEGGALDRVLAEAKARGPVRSAPTMGFLRLHAGRTLCLLDAAAPPRGPASVEGHASTLGIEVSAAGRPLIVSVGPGRTFGLDWQRAARATAAHSTVVVERLSSSRVLPEGMAARALGPQLYRTPRNVGAQRTDDLNGAWVLASHDGYVPTYGLVHTRRLFLAPDGRDLRGEDTLAASSRAQKRRFARAAAATGGGVEATAVFHLHPDVDPSRALGGAAVALRLPGGETWVFRQSGGTMELAESVYLDPAFPQPRPTRQIVVTARITGGMGQITWALRRAEDGARLAPAAASPDKVPDPPPPSAPGDPDPPQETPRDDA